MKPFTLILSALAAIVSLSAASWAQSGSFRQIDVGAELARVSYLKSGAAAIAITETGLRVLRIDLKTGDVTSIVDERQAAVPVKYSDFELSADERFLFLAGRSARTSSHGVVKRLDLVHTQVAEIKFFERFDNPSIAVGHDGAIYVGDTSSSIISVLSASEFKEGELVVARRSGPSKRLFYRLGTPAELAIDASGSTLWVKSHLGSGLTAMNPRTGSMIIAFSERHDDRHTPIAIGAPMRHDDDKRNFLLAASVVEAALIDYPVGDPLGFKLQKGAHGLNQTYKSGDDTEGSPMIISSDAKANLIVLGNRLSRRIYIFKQGQKNSPTMERLGTGTIDFFPQSVAVSPAGDEVMFTAPHAHSLTLLTDVKGWLAAQTDRTAITQLVRRVQRGLASLKYPLQVTDGIAGAETRAAVRAFQSANGMTANGEIDENVASSVDRILQFGKIHKIVREEIARMGDTPKADLAAIRETLGDKCSPLAQAKLCFSSAGRSSSDAIGKNVQEHYCSAEDRPNNLQADVYFFSGATAEYVCSWYAPCAFARYNKPATFDAACRTKR